MKIFAMGAVLLFLGLLMLLACIAMCIITVDLIYDLRIKIIELKRLK